MGGINYFAVGLAAMSSFVLGGLWYSPALFGTAWQRETGDMRKPDDGHQRTVFAIAFAFSLLAAFAYAALMPSPESWVQALLQGLAVGFGFAATSFGINYQFANRSRTLLAIDGGYHTMQFGLYGLILGLWH